MSGACLSWVQQFSRPAGAGSRSSCHTGLPGLPGLPGYAPRPPLVRFPSAQSAATVTAIAGSPALEGPGTLAAVSAVECSCPTASRPTVRLVAAASVPVRPSDRNRRRRASRAAFWQGAASISFDGGADLRRLARRLAARPRGEVYGVRVVVTAVDHSVQQVAEEARRTPAK